jgi:hypothetical protein
LWHGLLTVPLGLKEIKELQLAFAYGIRDVRKPLENQGKTASFCSEAQKSLFF